jgi:hypothetical protein
MTQQATIQVPSADTLRSYETLGNIGILLLVLFVFLVVGYFVGNTVLSWGKEFGGKVLDQLTRQTLALENVKQSNASMEINQARLHERLDNLFRCPWKACPLRPTDHIPHDQIVPQLKALNSSPQS